MASAALAQDPIDEPGIRLISADNHFNEPRDLSWNDFQAILKTKLRGSLKVWTAADLEHQRRPAKVHIRGAYSVSTSAEPARASV